MTDLPSPDEIRDWRASVSAHNDQALAAMTQPEVLAAAREFTIATAQYAHALAAGGLNPWQVTAAICGAAIPIAGETLER